VLAFLVVLALSAHARAQVQAQGFSVERFYPSAPGAGWFVMDDLDLHGGLGGVLSSTLGYSSTPLRVTDGTHRVAVVSDEAFLDIAAAITWDRWRFYVNFDSPLVISGQSGVVGGYSFTGPSVTLGSNPDTLWDARIGTDVRIVGKPGGHFRFGASAQLFVPFGTRADYDTDDTFRGMIRLLFAGDAPYFTYAAQLGVHIRPLDDSPIPGSPKGSELLFGVAAGAKLPLGRLRSWAAVIGPEIYGATAFQSFLQTNGTALEGLLTGRVEGTRDGPLQVRVKLGIGAGLNHHFGAAEWRLVVGIEMFGHLQRRPAHPPPAP
jgi:hypothetical protein